MNFKEYIQGAYRLIFDNTRLDEKRIKNIVIGEMDSLTHLPSQNYTIKGLVIDYKEFQGDIYLEQKKSSREIGMFQGRETQFGLEFLIKLENSKPNKFVVPN